MEDWTIILQGFHYTYNKTYAILFIVDSVRGGPSKKRSQFQGTT